MKTTDFHLWAITALLHREKCLIISRFGLRVDFKSGKNLTRDPRRSFHRISAAQSRETRLYIFRPGGKFSKLVSGDSRQLDEVSADENPQKCT